MKKTIIAAIAMLLAATTFAQTDSSDIAIPLKFKRQHIFLFAYYLQSFDNVNSYDLYTRMKNAVVTADTARQSSVIGISISTRDYNIFNQMMNADQVGQLYLIYDELVSGAPGYTGLLAQLATLMTSGTATQKAGAKKMFSECDKQTKAMSITLRQKIFMGSQFLFPQ